MTLDEAFSHGSACLQAGNYPEAENVFRQIIAAQPNHLDSYFSLAMIAMSVNQPDAALLLVDRAAAIAPQHPVVLVNRGRVLDRLDRDDEAREHYEQAVRLAPDDPQTLTALGDFVGIRYELERATELYEKAIAVAPSHGAAYTGYSVVLHKLNRLDDAISAARKALALDPDLFMNHTNISYSLLLDGQYEEGWAQHEWRLLHPNYNVTRLRRQAGLGWNGADAQGKKVRVSIEGGLGDTIMFARYVPMIAARNAKVSLMVQPELLRLFENFPDTHELITPENTPPSSDLGVPPFSLPSIFGTTVATIPNTVPYLHARPDLKEAWRQRLASDANFKVGLVWAGKIGDWKSGYNLRRSIKIEELAPLAEIKGATYYSLQKGDPAADVARAPAGMNIVDLSHELTDFADTAAALANLDLLISVDTSIVHLAGAMARPVWTLVAFSPDWRWMLDRDDTPWYPTMRLFRQPQRYDWKSVVDRVADELRSLLVSRPGVSQGASHGV